MVNMYAYRTTPGGQNSTTGARRLPAKGQYVFVGVDYDDSYTIINTKHANSISMYQFNQSKTDDRCAIFYFIIVSMLLLAFLICKDQR